MGGAVFRALFWLLRGGRGPGGGGRGRGRERGVMTFWLGVVVAGGRMGLEHCNAA